MEELTYLSFDLWLEKVAEGYVARARDSLSRAARGDFHAPFNDSEIDRFWRQVALDSGDQRADSSTPKNVGGSLFKALFKDDLLSCFRTSLDQADRERKGLRILLHLTEVPELAGLPWEYLYDATSDRFFALSSRTPVVRHLEQLAPPQPLTVRPPLKMLVMVASPSGYPPLNGEEEWRQLRAALSDLEKEGLVEIQRLQGATLPALRRQLRRGGTHLFHFIGHGGFDPRSEEGVLILEDESGAGVPVPAEDVGVVLHDHAPRLVVLNACEGAHASGLNPFSGVAQTLLRQGVPAVLAMQTEVRDDFAMILAEELYSALADGYPVDACLAEARKALESQRCAAWGTPVLYMRAPDGRILELEKPDLEVPVAGQPNRGAARRIWTAASALALVVLLWLAYERWRDSPPVEGGSSAAGPAKQEAETRGGLEASSSPPAVEADRVADAETEPIARRPFSEPEGPAREQLTVSGSPGAGGARPAPPPPEPQPAQTVITSWPRGDRKQATHRNDLDGLTYVWVPQGRFRYGCSPGDDLCESDEIPPSEEEIERGFWLGQTEVTVGAYKRFRTHLSQLPPSPSFNDGWLDDAQPMVNVSRPEAERFCEWAGARLPTEIEWEYAARAEVRRALPLKLSDEAWFAEQSGLRAHAVSQKEPNGFGLYDMLGNADEWVAPLPDQPAGTGILRGGSWLHEARFLRFSFRLHEAPSERSEMYGFRCLADAS